MSDSMHPNGKKIATNSDRSLRVSNNPIVPFIEGDGIGADIAPVMRAVVDAAIAKAYGKARAFRWLEILSGEKAARAFDGEWYPAATLDAIKEYGVVIKGPLTTPIGQGFRSLNIALRQEFDLYIAQRAVRWLHGMPAPVRDPHTLDWVIFRESAEDSYAGIEWPAGSPQAEKVVQFLREEMGVKKIRFPDECSIGIRPVSKEGSLRLIRRAIQYAIDHHRPSVTLVHKGDVLRHTEGAFRSWGYELAQDEFNARPLADTPWLAFAHPHSGEAIVIKDVSTDRMLQHALLRAGEHSVIATLNQSGDYLADAVSAQVGGIGIAPSANLGDGVAVFEATHGTAPKYAGQDSVNPTSLILSAEMLLRHLRWNEAADRIIAGLNGAISAKTVTADVARNLDGARTLKCSEFGAAVIAHMG